MLETNKIYLGDCLDYMAHMPDKCVDLVLTDPPYGIGITGKIGGNKPFGNKKISVGGNKICKAKEYISFDDSTVPEKIYFDELQRISKNQIIFGGELFCGYVTCFIMLDCLG